MLIKGKGRIYMKNKLNKIDLSLKELEGKLKDIDLNFISTKRKDVEYGIRFPLFVRSFYDYIEEYSMLPSQKDFFDYYIENNQNSKNIQKLDIDQLGGLKARLYRVYPSFIRDFHFAKTLEEKTPLDEVIYNVKLDTKDGIDVLVRENGIHYAISLYTNTRRANIARVKKIDHRDDKDDYIYIELPLNFKGAKEVGDFFVYGKREMVEVLNIIIKTQKKVS